MRRTICTTLSLRGRPKEVPWLRNRGVPERGKPFALAVVTALGLAVIASSSQADAQSILGTAESSGVLGGPAVTNTGPSTIHGDVGVSPGSFYSPRRANAAKEWHRDVSNF
jgi:hypothetical protein